VFGVLAMTNTLSWLSTDTNAVADARNWLNDHISWMKDV
jgi:hypothetical protein